MLFDPKMLFCQAASRAFFIVRDLCSVALVCRQPDGTAVARGNVEV
jgi:hypothetical protein